MEKSTSLTNLAKALIQFRIKVDKIKKDAKNPFFKSKYASLSNILESINTPLIESGLAFSQLPTGEHGLTTLLIHGESGEFIQSYYEMKPVQDNPQSKGSVITYQRRYALAAVLGLNIEEDDDGNAAAYTNDYKLVDCNHSSKRSGPPTNFEEIYKPWLNKTVKKNGPLSENWLKVIQALQGGKYTIEQVESKYKLSRQIREELEQIVQQSQQEKQHPYAMEEEIMMHTMDERDSF